MNDDQFQRRKGRTSPNPTRALAAISRSLFETRAQWRNRGERSHTNWLEASAAPKSAVATPSLPRSQDAIAIPKNAMATRVLFG